MSKKVRIGLIQVKMDYDSAISERLDMLHSLGESCLKDGADLVFFPEAFQYAGNDLAIISEPDRLREMASAWKERCARLAREYRAYVVPWDYEADSENNIYNASYILDRDGNEVGRYRKVHLTYTDQKWGIKSGSDFPVFDLDIGKVGIMICFDNYWPESSRVLALKGAEMILFPLYGDTLIPQWELKLRARAADNSLYIASCQLEGDYNVAFSGLVNPLGDIVAKLDSAPSYVVVEAELGRRVITCSGGQHSEDLRWYLEKCRKPEVYGEITKSIEAPKAWDEIFSGNR